MRLLEAENRSLKWREITERDRPKTGDEVGHWWELGQMSSATGIQNGRGLLGRLSLPPDAIYRSLQNEHHPRDSPPPKPEHKNHDRPPLDLDNVLRQVNAIQEQLRREQEAKERK